MATGDGRACGTNYKRQTESALYKCNYKKRKRTKLSQTQRVGSEVKYQYAGNKQ